MMIFLSGFVGTLLVLTAEARVGNSSELKFCTETKECLLYDLICKTEDYEVRHYSSAKWASTTMRAFFMETMAVDSFRKLFKYISGDNANGTKIEMTTPVLITMPDKSILQRADFTMSFLLPSKFQDNPPKPNSADVEITTMNDTVVYVKSYGGWMTSLRDSDYAFYLKKSIGKYKPGFHYGVGYNSPMRLLNRHNEVWFVAAGAPKCGGSQSSEELDSD